MDNKKLKGAEILKECLSNVKGGSDSSETLRCPLCDGNDWHADILGGDIRLTCMNCGYSYVD